MCLLNKSLPDPGSNGIRGKYLISAVYFLCGLASDVLLKTPARAGVVLKSPYEPRNKSAKNSHPPILVVPNEDLHFEVNLDDDAGELCVFSRLARTNLTPKLSIHRGHPRLRPADLSRHEKSV
jgi:hypothetical protein